MKKVKISPRAKRSIVAGGTVLVGVFAVFTVLAFNTGAKTPDASSTPSASSAVSAASVSVDSIKAGEDSSSNNGAAFVPSSGVSKTTQLTKIEKPSSTPPKPVVQGDTSSTSGGKKTSPTNPALTDKSKKPTYTTKPTANGGSKNTSSKSGSGTTSKPSKNDNTSQPSGGKPGQKYVPGFGWQTPTGGETRVVSGDWGGGSQVGIMD